jgi:hypothetical protein
MFAKKTIVAISAVAIMIAAGVGGAQLWAEHEANKAVDTMIANLPVGQTGHYDTLSYNLFTQTLRLDGLEIKQNDKPLFTVRSTVLHHVSGTGQSNAPAHVDTVSLTDLDVWQGGKHVKVVEVDAKDLIFLAPGVPVPTALPAWMVSPLGSNPIAIGSIKVSKVSSDSGETITTISAQGYQTGKLHMICMNGYADSNGASVDSMTATDIDFDGFDRVFNAARYTPDAPAWDASHVLLGHFEASKFVAKENQTTVYVGHLALDHLAGRPFASASTLNAMQTPGFARDAGEAFTVDRFVLSDTSTVDGSTQTAVSIGQFKLAGYRDGAVDDVVLDRFSVSNHGNLAGSFDHFEITGVSATAILHAPLDLSGDQLATIARNGGVRVASVQLTNVMLPAPNGSGNITLKSMQETMVYGNIIQTSFAMNGLSIPAGIDPDFADMMKQVNVDPIVLSLAANGSYDVEKRNMRIASAMISAAQLGSLKFSGNFSNIPQNLADGSAANDGTDTGTGAGAVMQGFDQASVGGFAVTFNNEGLVQQVTKLLAANLDVTPDQMAANVQSAAATNLPEQGDAGLQLEKFLADPKTLTLTASPDAPVPLANFSGDGQTAAVSALNLHLSAN